jgi:hypothetical protein
MSNLARGGIRLLGPLRRLPGLHCRLNQHQPFIQMDGQAWFLDDQNRPDALSANRSPFYSSPSDFTMPHGATEAASEQTEESVIAAVGPLTGAHAH